MFECSPCVCVASSTCRQSLCALDSLEAAEVPAFLKTGSDTSQLLSEGAGQPRKKSLHLTGVDLRTRTHNTGKRSCHTNKLLTHLNYQTFLHYSHLCSPFSSCSHTVLIQVSRQYELHDRIYAGSQHPGGLRRIMKAKMTMESEIDSTSCCRLPTVPCINN